VIALVFIVTIVSLEFRALGPLAYHGEKVNFLGPI
jgi:hypothetical protein